MVGVNQECLIPRFDLLLHHLWDQIQCGIKRAFLSVGKRSTSNKDRSSFSCNRSSDLENKLEDLIEENARTLRIESLVCERLSDKESILDRTFTHETRDSRH